MSAHLLVGTDGSPAAMAAVRYAAADAARRRVALKVVHACETWVLDLPPRPPTGFTDSVTEFCEGVVRTAGIVAAHCAPGLEITTEVAFGHAVEVLRERATAAEQVVVGSRGRGGFAGLRPGSVSLGLAGHVPVPVVVVPDSSRDSGRAAWDEVVVGLDGSPRSEAALDYAFAEAARRGARLHVVHAWHMPALAPYAVAYASLIEDVYNAERAAVRHLLEPWRDKYAGVEVRETPVCGHPVMALRNAADTADLLVVGSRGLGVIGSAVLGSVSHGVLRHAHCPVAVVRAAV